MIDNLSRHLKVTALLAGTLIAAGAFGSIAETKTVMKLTHVVPAKAPRGQGAELTAKLINQDKRCDIAAKVYHAAQLGGTTDLIEGLQIGSIELARYSLLRLASPVQSEPCSGIVRRSTWTASPSIRRSARSILSIETLLSVGSRSSSNLTGFYARQVPRQVAKRRDATRQNATRRDMTGQKIQREKSQISNRQTFNWGSTELPKSRSSIIS